MQIFKSHISLVEGHLKMLDTVHRHTVPESDNYRTMTQFMVRAREMLHASKETERTFVSVSCRNSVSCGLRLSRYSQQITFTRFH